MKNEGFIHGFNGFYMFLYVSMMVSMVSMMVSIFYGFSGLGGDKNGIMAERKSLYSGVMKQ